MSTSTNETLDTNETVKQILDTVNELISIQIKIIASINSCLESNKTQEKYVIIESKLDTPSNQLAEVISEDKTLKAKIEQIDGKITTLETACTLMYFPPRSDLNLYNSHVNVIDNLMNKYYNNTF